MSRTLVAVAFAAVIAIAAGAARAESPGTDLTAALRAGGYVLLVRPDAETGEPAERSALVLGPTARTQARTVGAALAALRIPIDTVLASTDARSLTTARLAFEDRNPAIGSAAARGWVAPPRPGANTVVVAPGLPGVKAPAGSVVVLAQDAGGYRVVRVIDAVELAGMTSY
jgi:hypothetical protein